MSQLLLSALAVVCPNCDGYNSPRSSACAVCGQPLAESSPARSPASKPGVAAPRPVPPTGRPAAVATFPGPKAGEAGVPPTTPPPPGAIPP
ncbi:hypothetical protein ACLESO_39075, partial [Pyxidicoccus sp. 3LG]